MVLYYQLDGDVLEVYESRDDTTPVFTRTQSGGLVINTETLKQETATYINSQRIPDETAYADAISMLAAVAAGNFAKYELPNDEAE